MVADAPRLETEAHGGSTWVQVVVVNYRTPDLAIDCLRAVADEVAALPGVRVTVVDNASEDGSVEQIQAAIREQHWQEWAALLPLARNDGYAAGNNAVIRAALRSAQPPSYFWLLNPDTRPRSGALATLLEWMERRPLAGIAGSQLVNPGNGEQASAFRFPNVINELDAGLRLGLASRLLRKWSQELPHAGKPRAVDWLRGASMVVRREVWETVGLLDEGFFLYFEDVDLCRRAQGGGWECWHVPRSRVTHLHGQSPGGSGPRRWWDCIPEHWLASRRRYWQKHHGWGLAILADVCWIAALALWRARRAVQRKPDLDPPHFLRDSIRNSSLFRRERS